jgi:peptidylamidoglycolate lyase
MGVAGAALAVVFFAQAQGQVVTGEGLDEDDGSKGFQEQYGQYLIDEDWPKPLPGNEGEWVSGSVQSVFAESADRIYILQRGELPYMERPEVRQMGPSISYPVRAVPFRNHSQGPYASPPNQAADTGHTNEGWDWRWRNILFIVDREGNLIDSWTQWDSLFRRPHAIFISPYDPEKHVWVVDDRRHAIFKFTNDGSELVQTIGTPNEPGDDETHYNRPTFLAWLPDGTMYLTDGYTNTRVVKFDAEGNYLMRWGERGDGSGNETRPGYFNTVHGLAVDPVDRRVYVSDRLNRRIQVFDENGEFLDMWWIGHRPAHIYQLYMGADRTLWGADAGTHKMVQWDRDGRFQQAWGFLSESPGGLWCNHAISVDEEGNVYTADVCSGRAQKFIPKPGADPAKLVSRPVRAVWQN